MGQGTQLGKFDIKKCIPAGPWGTYDEEVVQVIQHWLYPMMLIICYCIKDFGGRSQSK